MVIQGALMNILDEIILQKQIEVKDFYSIYSLTQLEGTFTSNSSPSFVSLLNKSKSIEIIAEIKRGSPSKGLFAPDLCVESVVNSYTTSGAAALSVLTDQKFFYGSYNNLKLARANTTLPILCKDFIIDKIQIALAKHYGASMILLIVAALSPTQLRGLYNYASSIGLEVIFEIHSLDEYHAIENFDIKLLGINNRNLKTFETSINNTLSIINQIQNRDLHFISESGIKTERDVLHLADVNVSALLIGEALIKSNDRTHLISTLRKRKKNENHKT